MHYTETQREMQAAFDSRRLADRVGEISGSAIPDRIRSFIESRDMFFLATVRSDGWPDTSYKGGVPGFVRVIDETTLEFPLYDGNGMFLSAGNMVGDDRIAMLFVDFEAGSRLRIHGRATVTPVDERESRRHGALLTVRVAVEAVFPNCKRYVHRYELVERSVFAPEGDREVPVPDWKLQEHFDDALPHSDPARDPAARSAPSIPF